MKYIPHIFIGFLLALPVSAFAAQLAIEPQEVTLKAGETTTITLLISTRENINTVGVGVPLPESLTYVNSEKGVVIEQWVNLPSYDSGSKSLVLAGIIPNGWHGKAKLATFTLLAQKTGTYGFAYDPAQTEVYLNDGRATEAPITYGPITSTIPWWPIVLGVVLIVGLILMVRKIVRVQLI